MKTTVRIQEADFSLEDEYQHLRGITRHIGAVITFTGLVREVEHLTDAHDIQSMTLQHYPGMTEKLLQEIINEAGERWSLIAVTVIHRVGLLLPNDQIVFVGVASAHRQAAFSAAEFIMDYLKTRATFWKSIDQNGEKHWVESKETDQDAASRWKSQCSPKQ